MLIKVASSSNLWIKKGRYKCYAICILNVRTHYVYDWRQRCLVTLNQLCILIISQTDRFAFRRGYRLKNFTLLRLTVRCLVNNGVVSGAIIYMDRGELTKLRERRSIGCSSLLRKITRRFMIRKSLRNANFAINLTLLPRKLHEINF